MNKLAIQFVVDEQDEVEKRRCVYANAATAAANERTRNVDALKTEFDKLKGNCVGMYLPNGNRLTCYSEQWKVIAQVQQIEAPDWKIRK